MNREDHTNIIRITMAGQEENKESNKDGAC